MTNRRISMGEQSHPLIAGHVLSPIMRSSRGKFFVSLAVLGTMCFILFLLSNTHSNLKQLEAVNEKCQQQRDSLSAQLQVVYEHKNRLEKSLQAEKSDHKRTKEEFDSIRTKQDMESKLQSEKESTLNKQITSLKSDVAELESEKKRLEDSLKEQIEQLQTQKDEELKKLQSQINELSTEKDKIEQAKSSLAWELEQRQGEINLSRLLQQQLTDKLNACVKQQQQDSNVKPANQDPAVKLIKEISTASPGKLFSEAPALPSNINVLKQPHAEKQLPEKINLKDTKTLEPNFNKNNTLFQQLPKPNLLENSIGINKQVNENPEENEIREAPRNFLKPPFAENNLPQENQMVEKGEFPNALPLGQVEGPDNFNRHNEEQFSAASNLKKVALPPPPNVNEQGANDLAQVHDMLDKSPGDTNNIQDSPGANQQALPDFQAAVLNKGDSPLVKPRVELPDDKQYADEDDDNEDGDNEEEMGVAQGLRGKVFQEQDFDDQEPPNENAPGAKRVEGVVVNPK